MRGIFRAAAFTLWTLGIGIGWLCVRPFLNATSQLDGGPLVLKLWARGVCRILNVRVSVSGIPHPGPVLIASNHIGYLDIAVLASRVPVVFVSKSEVKTWPVLGPFGSSVGTIFLDRQRLRAMVQVAESMAECFKQGQSIAIFPEGTTKEKRDISELRPAFFEPALRLNVPIQGVALDYVPLSPRDNRRSVAWFGDDAFLPHFFRLLCRRGWIAKVHFQTPDGLHANRNEAAQSIRMWMESSLCEMA